MKHLTKIAFIALAAISTYGCAHAGDDGANNAAPTVSADAATAGSSVFDEGRIVPQAVEKTAPTFVRQMLPRGARSMFCLKTKLGAKDVLVHGWNPAKGNGHLDILVPSTTKATRKTRSRAIYTRLGGARVGCIESDNYSVRLAPLRAGKPGWVMAVNWAQSQAAGAFASVAMVVFVAPTSDGGKVLRQATYTESSSGGNEFYDLRRDKSGDAFLMLNSESFDAATKTLRPYVWNGSKFVNSGRSATLPLIFKENS